MKTVLITGASSGIGYDLALLFAGDGYRVILVARREEELKKLADKIREAKGPEALIIPMDLSKPEAPGELMKRLEGSEIDVLVNNAGFGLYGEFVGTDLRRELEMIQLNISTLVELTKRVLPAMKKRGSGRILNVASTAAFQPGPLMSIYYATKAFVLSFSEAIAEELRGTGVTVSTLCPGPTTTEFAGVARMEKVKLLHKVPMADSKSVALAGYRGALAGKRIIVPGVANRMIVQSLRVSPRSLVTRVVRKLQDSG